MTWRTTDELLERVRRPAPGRGHPLNDRVGTVLDAARVPTHAGSVGAQVRERLARARLLDDTDQIHTPATDPVLIAAVRARAGRGTRARRADRPEARLTVFADSSAVVKLYADEPGAELVRGVEVPAALWRKCRLGELPEAAVREGVHPLTG